MSKEQLAYIQLTGAYIAHIYEDGVRIRKHSGSSLSGYRLYKPELQKLMDALVENKIVRLPASDTEKMAEVKSRCPRVGKVELKEGGVRLTLRSIEASSTDLLFITDVAKEVFGVDTYVVFNLQQQKSEPVETPKPVAATTEQIPMPVGAVQVADTLDNCSGRLYEISEEQAQLHSRAHGVYMKDLLYLHLATGETLLHNADIKEAADALAVNVRNRQAGYIADKFDDMFISAVPSDQRIIVNTTKFSDVWDALQMLRELQCTQDRTRAMATPHIPIELRWADGGCAHIKGNKAIIRL